MTGPERVLVSAGLTPARARDLVDAELVEVLGSAVVVLGESVEPITGEHRVLVPFGGEAVVRLPSLLAELGERARTRHADATSLVLRLPWGVEPPDGFQARLQLRYVEIEGRPEAAVPPPGWSVEPYHDGHRKDVGDLLLRALVEGYRTVGPGPAGTDLTALVADMLDRVGADVTIFCAAHRGRFVGHSTVVWDEDDLSGDRRPELFDVFVLPEDRGSPAGRLLVAAARAWAAGQGLSLRGHVVGDDANAEGVAARLVRQGWRPAESYWSIPLGVQR